MVGIVKWKKYRRIRSSFVCDVVSQRLSTFYLVRNLLKSLEEYMIKQFRLRCNATSRLSCLLAMHMSQMMFEVAFVIALERALVAVVRYFLCVFGIRV